jgi:hypothetical protein
MVVTECGTARARNWLKKPDPGPARRPAGAAYGLELTTFSTHAGFYDILYIRTACR